MASKRGLEKGVDHLRPRRKTRGLRNEGFQVGKKQRKQTQKRHNHNEEIKKKKDRAKRTRLEF